MKTRPQIYWAFCILIGAASCGKTIIKTYDSETWNKEFQVITSDSTGNIHIDFKNSDHQIIATLHYESSYQVANEVERIDFDIYDGPNKIESTSQKYSADDGDYKLIVGYQNTISLDKKDVWKNVGTQLKIDTVKNEYLKFRINIKKKYKFKGELPQKINLMLHSKTKSGTKDTLVNLLYEEYEDHSAPFRFH